MNSSSKSLNLLPKSELIDIIIGDRKRTKSITNLLDNLNGISWEFDLLHNKFTTVSPTTKKILGYEVDEWTDFNSWKNMISKEDKERVSSYCTTQTRDGKDHIIEYRMLKKNGELIWVLDIITLGKNDNGEATKLYGFILDITDKKNIQLKLEEEHKFLQTIIDSMPDPIMLINSDYSVRMMNKARKKDLIGRNFIDNNSPKCYEISHFRDIPCDGSEYECPLRTSLETKKNSKIIQKSKDKDGNERFYELSSAPIFDELENCTGIIKTAIDITEHINLRNSLQQTNKELNHIAHHDYLTGLPNRALFMDRLTQTIKDSKRKKTKFALFFMDLDHFKEINDSYGHDMGDAVLKECSQRFLSCIRDNDTLSRLAGDEFTIIIKDVKNQNDIHEIAEKVITTIAQPMQLNNQEVSISTSIGICIFPDDADNVEDILISSDNTMYEAKVLGKNNFQFYR